MIRANSSKAEITLDLNEPETDRKLLKKCGFGLYNFALSLAVILNDRTILPFPDIWKIKNAIIPGTIKVKEEIIRLKEIRSKLLKLAKNLNIHMRALPTWHKIKREGFDENLRTLILDGAINDSVISNDLVLKIYKLDKTLNIIDEEIAFLDKSMWKPFKKRSGKAVEPKIIIQAFWSLVIRKGPNADMKYVDDLIYWFSNKIGETEYSNKLAYEPKRSSVYRFLNDNKESLHKDRILFFPNMNERKPKSAIVNKSIQIIFAKKSTDVNLFPNEQVKRNCPSIIFQ